MTKTLPHLSITGIDGPACLPEGPLSGTPAVTVHASAGSAPPMRADAVMAEVHRLSAGAPLLVSLAGREPGAQPFGPLAEMLQRQGHAVQVRTAGTSPAGWFGAVDFVDVVLPPSSSGCTVSDAALDRTFALALSGTAQVSLVLTVADDDDYEHAIILSQRFDPIPVFLHPALPGEQPFRDLARQVCADRWTAVRVVPRFAEF